MGYSNSVTADTQKFSIYEDWLMLVRGVARIYIGGFYTVVHKARMQKFGDYAHFQSTRSDQRSPFVFKNMKKASFSTILALKYKENTRWRGLC